MSEFNLQKEIDEVVEGLQEIIDDIEHSRTDLERLSKLAQRTIMTARILWGVVTVEHIRNSDRDKIVGKTVEASDFILDAEFDN